MAKTTLWHQHSTTSPLLEEFTAGQDRKYDNFLIEVDLWGSLAHAEMLGATGLVDATSLAQIKKGLVKLLASYHQQQLQLSADDEDVHSMVEAKLTEWYPHAGAMLHTGRSRNDQVLTDLRLLTKTELFQIVEQVLKLIDCFYHQVNHYHSIALPGMTHMQPAMVSSVGQWLGAFAESLLDDLSIVEAAFNLNDQSPLGSGAGYGVSLPIDRELTAKLLGFAQVQNNATYCQNSKGKIEAAVIHSLTQLLATINKFATDCLLYTTEPFTFISFNSSLGTGSSIMPQKTNWDGLELLRARYHSLISFQSKVQSLSANLPSGYNRDSQEIKYALIDSFSLTHQCLAMAEAYVTSLEINQKSILSHLPKELFAAHWAYQIMTEQKLPFRQAYHWVKEHLAEIPKFNPDEVLQTTQSLGGPGNLHAVSIDQKRKKLERKWLAKKQTFYNTITSLIKG